MDPEGNLKKVSYVAGKNGFQASGDHLPVAPPAPPAPQQANSRPEVSIFTIRKFQFSDFMVFLFLLFFYPV